MLDMLDYFRFRCRQASTWPDWMISDMRFKMEFT